MFTTTSGSVTYGVVDHWQVHDLLALEDRDQHAIVYEHTTRQISVRALHRLPTHRFTIILRGDQLEDYLSIYAVCWSWPADVAEWMEAKGYGDEEAIELLGVDPWRECEGELIDDDGYRHDEHAMQVAERITEDWWQRRGQLEAAAAVVA